MVIRISYILYERGYRSIRTDSILRHNYIYSIYKKGIVREKRINREFIPIVKNIMVYESFWFVIFIIMKKIIYFSLLFVLMSSCNNRYNNSETYLVDDLMVNKYKKPITGIFFETYPNDSLRFEIEYSKGLKNGFSREFYDNGQIKKEVNFVNGQREGSYKGYMNQGSLLIDGYYKNNIRDSIWKLYDWDLVSNIGNGSIIEKHVFKEGNREFTMYDLGDPRIGASYNISGSYNLDKESTPAKLSLLSNCWDIETNLVIRFNYDSNSSKRWKEIFDNYYILDLNNRTESQDPFVKTKFNKQDFFNDTLPKCKYSFRSSNSGSKFPFMVYDKQSKIYKWFLQNGEFFFSSKEFNTILRPPESIVSLSKYFPISYDYVNPTQWDLVDVSNKNLFNEFYRAHLTPSEYCRKGLHSIVYDLSITEERSTCKINKNSRDIILQLYEDFNNYCGGYINEFCRLY